MEFFKKTTHIDFLGTRRLPLLISGTLILATLILLYARGLNFGLDFTGGTLVEIGYAQPVEIADVRQTLKNGGISNAVVQHFGTSRDLMVRLPVGYEKDRAKLGDRVINVLRSEYKETIITGGPGGVQRCTVVGADKAIECNVQLRRIEFVGPQVGSELAEKGGLALLYTLMAILIYVIIRFEWRFAVGSIIATAHDVLLTFGFFSLTQIEFSLSVLAAILAVLGYSLNDTIVVFDRIRENFRRMRQSTVTDIMNASLNQTLSRTIVTSMTTMLAVLSLFFLGGEILHGFSIALIIGIIVGTYSSIYIATPVVLALGVSREDLLPVKKEGATDNQP